MPTTIRLNSRGMRELLNSAHVGDMLEERMQKALSVAKSNAPVNTGAYRDALHVERAHTDRVVARLIGGTDHDMWVEAETGNLARALDAAR
jgi:hypothetical protein